jgi:hypothetical protein
LPLGDKKKGVGKSNKGKFGIIKRISPYFEEKKRLKITKFKQCVTIGHQN